VRKIAATGLATLAVVSAAVFGTAGAAHAVMTAAQNELSGVSCVSAKHCVAVGSSTNAKTGAGTALARIWNGTKWSAVAVRLPAGADDSVLLGVSCMSASYCVAIGAYAKSSGANAPTNAFAVTWKGTGWTAVTLPKPATGAPVTIPTSVSCAAAGKCLAIGMYGTVSGNPRPLAWSLAGTTWTDRKPPAPAGTQSALLTGVSCGSASFCVLAGEASGKASSSTLLDSWNGTSFALMKPAIPAGDALVVLSTVSCASATSCTALGSGISMTNPNSPPGLAERWNGKAWSAARLPAAASRLDLAGISCPTATRCVAAGANANRAAAMSYNGKAWTVTSVPAPAKGTIEVFHSVSCLSATVCVAVGQSGPANGSTSADLAGFWNGKSWKLVTTS